MSLSIQTNIASLVAQNNIRLNTNFQSATIQRLSSGYKINSSADDAAGLAVANKFRGDISELTQGVKNSNDGVSALQIIDGGLSNISQIVDRLRTLATQSASSTFTGNRNTLNNEYQSLLGEIDRQASNIKLNTGGAYNTNLVVYTGGGSNASNAQVSVDLSGTANAVDSTSLGIHATNIAGGGSTLSAGTANTVRLDDSAVTFLAGGGSTQAFNFHINTGTGNQDIAITVNGGASGLTGSQVIDSLNTSLQSYGIAASISSAGTLQFGGSTAFSVTTAAASAGNAVATTNSATVNTADARVGTGAFAAFSGSDTESVVFQNASGSYTANISAANGTTIDTTLTALNTALGSSGIYAIKDAAGTGISFQSSNTFSVTSANNAGAGAVFGGAGGAQAVTAASSNATNTGGAIVALANLATAVGTIGVVQGRVGAGENKLSYAINLAQSQITNYSAAEAGIRDADVAAEAANLTKAQVLQQASLAALAQANSAPQSVLSLLKG